jgi:hypothetical protein
MGEVEDAGGTLLSTRRRAQKGGCSNRDSDGDDWRPFPRRQESHDWTSRLRTSSAPVWHGHCRRLPVDDTTIACGMLTPRLHSGKAAPSIGSIRNARQSTREK